MGMNDGNDVRHGILDGVAVCNQNRVENQSRRVNVNPFTIAGFKICGGFIKHETTELMVDSSALSGHCPLNFDQITQKSDVIFQPPWLGKSFDAPRSLALPIQRKMEQPSKSCFGL